MQIIITKVAKQGLKLKKQIQHGRAPCYTSAPLSCPELGGLFLVWTLAAFFPHHVGHYPLSVDRLISFAFKKPLAALFLGSEWLSDYRNFFSFTAPFLPWSHPTSSFPFVLCSYMEVFLPFQKSEVFKQCSVGVLCGITPLVDIFLMFCGSSKLYILISCYLAVILKQQKLKPKGDIKK